MIPKSGNRFSVKIMLHKEEFRTADSSAARYPEAERFPDILSEIAGGPKP